MIWTQEFRNNILHDYVFIKSFWKYQESILQLHDDDIEIFNNIWNIDNMAINVIVDMCMFVCWCVCLCFSTSKALSCLKWCSKHTLGYRSTMLCCKNCWDTSANFLRLPSTQSILFHLQIQNFCSAPHGKGEWNDIYIWYSIWVWPLNATNLWQKYNKDKEATLI